MRETDYDYIQTKLSYSMGIDPVRMGGTNVTSIAVDHEGKRIFERTIGNSMNKVVNDVNTAMVKLFSEQYSLLEIKNTDRLTIKNPKYEMRNNPNKYEEYLITSTWQELRFDGVDYQYRQLKEVTFILNRIPNSNGTYTLRTSGLETNEWENLRMEDIKNIDIFETKLMNLLSNNN